MLPLKPMLVFIQPHPMFYHQMASGAFYLDPTTVVMNFLNSARPDLNCLKFQHAFGNNAVIFGSQLSHSSNGSCSMTSIDATSKLGAPLKIVTTSVNNGRSACGGGMIKKQRQNSADSSKSVSAYAGANIIQQQSLCSPQIRGVGMIGSSGTVRYKTELCRTFMETGVCKYGEKCQFAHGVDDLRSVPRHPKYKTEQCRTYHTNGFCPYGRRCHFIHNEPPSVYAATTTAGQSPQQMTPDSTSGSISANNDSNAKCSGNQQRMRSKSVLSYSHVSLGSTGESPTPSISSEMSPQSFSPACCSSNSSPVEEDLVFPPTPTSPQYSPALHGNSFQAELFAQFVANRANAAISGILMPPPPRASMIPQPQASSAMPNNTQTDVLRQIPRLPSEVYGGCHNSQYGAQSPASTAFPSPPPEADAYEKLVGAMDQLSWNLLHAANTGIGTSSHPIAFESSVRRCNGLSQNLSQQRLPIFSSLSSAN